MNQLLNDEKAVSDEEVRISGSHIINKKLAI